MRPMARPRIDVRSIVGLDQDNMTRRMNEAADVTVQHWKRHAMLNLKSTSQEYRNAISIESVTGNGIKVTLRGTVPNIVEQGMGPGGIGTFGPYDVGRFMLKPGTKNLRYTRDGRMYVNVPFRRSEAAIEGFGGRAALAEAQSLDAYQNRHSLTDPKVRLASGLAPKIRGKTDFLVNRWQGPGGSMHGDGRIIARPPHSHDPLAGLVKMSAGYSSGKTQSFYMTWRRIVENGKPWISKGVEPRKLAEKVNVSSIIEMAFDVVDIAGPREWGVPV